MRVEKVGSFLVKENLVQQNYTVKLFSLTSTPVSERVSAEHNIHIVTTQPYCRGRLLSCAAHAGNITLDVFEKLADGHASVNCRF